MGKFTKHDPLLGRERIVSRIIETLSPGREGLHHLGAGGPIETSAADSDQEAIETPFL